VSTELITRDALDRIEENSRERIGAVEQRILAVMDERDKRYEERFNSSQLAVDAALNAAEKATTKAEGAAEKRFEAVNEFRATLSDQQRTLMPRSEAEQRLADLARQIADLKDERIQRAGQQEGASNTWALIAAGAGLLIGALGVASRFFA
jgi:hypothetical protein